LQLGQGVGIEKSLRVIVWEVKCDVDRVMLACPCIDFSAALAEKFLQAGRESRA
jgi:hypothetical protein